MSRKPPPPSVRVYLAGTDRDAANSLAAMLKLSGVGVGSLWHVDPGGALVHDPIAYATLKAANVGFFVRGCHATVWMVPPAGSAVGNPWELWYAIGSERRGAVLGSVSDSEFDRSFYHPAVSHFQDVESLTEWLLGLNTEGL